MLVHEDWAPIGAARFKELVEEKFYDDTRFFRVIPTFMVQFGLNGDPDVSSKCVGRRLCSEPGRGGNGGGCGAQLVVGACGKRQRDEHNCSGVGGRLMRAGRLHRGGRGGGWASGRDLLRPELRRRRGRQVALQDHQGRAGQGEQQAGLHHVRQDRRAEQVRAPAPPLSSTTTSATIAASCQQSHNTAFHQLCGQRAPGRHGLRAVWRGAPFRQAATIAALAASTDARPALPSQVEGDGMSVVKEIYNCGEKPNQGTIQTQGNAYLDKSFPELSKIVKATVLPATAEEL